VWGNPLPGLRYFGDLAARVQPAAGVDQPPLPAGVKCLPVTHRLPTIALEMVWRPGAGRAVEAVAAIATKLVGVAPGA
jgi:hypothetical protein